MPACVSSCPTGARSFGDLGDENSEVSKLVNEREGYNLMPEQDCKPINKYLPPKLNKDLFNKEELKPVSKNNNFEDWINEVENASK